MARTVTGDSGQPGQELDPLLQQQSERRRERFIGALLDHCAALVAAGQRPVLGLNGPVGAGKSTLSRLLQQRAQARGLALAIASIDDAYLPWQQRLQAMAGNPFGVNRVPPGSHDPGLLAAAIAAWRAQPAGPAPLELPRFDKTLRRGQGDRCDPWRGRADALLLEGWLVGYRPQGPGLAGVLARGQFLQGLSAEERCSLPRWDQALQAYQPLWDALNGLGLLWPCRWELPRRWRFQAEARQRRGGGGWMEPGALDALIRASLASLPPLLYGRALLDQADRVMLLDGRRRCRWEGSGADAVRQAWAEI
ncbi:hypothetical protein [Vulcanococcus limneticus]|uniref:hypothetical protein n=1 Tax=Vulcanococcus limneticus TaxID=2170428 RepID=UPI00398BDE44